MAVAALLVGALGCDGDRGGTPDELDTLAQAELDELVEEGLADELPPPLPREERELYELKMHRVQVADRMSGEVEVGVAPLALAMALFAVEGPADLVLAVFPVGRLGKAGEAAQLAFKHRGERKQAGLLMKAMKDFQDGLPPDAAEFASLAGKVTRRQRRALKELAAMESPNTLMMLMRRQLDGQADVTWIASKLGSRHVDREFARRFTFDADFAREFTDYSATPSWKLLQDVVRGAKVGKEQRAWLARKVQGLVAENAAAKMMRREKFVARVFRRPGVTVRGIGRGVRYGKSGRSIDIVAYDERFGMVIAEVKNWSGNTWTNASLRKRVLTQLRAHDSGVGEIAARNLPKRTVENKLLMVAESGWNRWNAEQQRLFEMAVNKMGWRVEEIPDSRIPSFGTVVDTLR